MPIGAPRLKGQEVKIITIVDGTVVDEIKAYTSFDDETKLTLKEDGFLGEVSNEFDQVFDGHSFGFEFQCHNARWENLKTAIIKKAKRETPNTIFNVIRLDFYPNGDTVTTPFGDVSWGPIPRTTSARGDFVKVKLSGACSEAEGQVNSFV